MKDNPMQTDPVFTKSGAVLGFVAYIIVALIIVWVFI